MMEVDPEAALVLGERAIVLAEEVGATRALAHALNNVGWMRMARGQERGRVALERSLTLAQQHGLATDAGRAFINLSGCLGRLGRWGEAIDCIESGVDYCRALGLDAWVKTLLAFRGCAELALGRWDAAAQTAGAILAGPRDQILQPRIDALTVLALVRARRGDPEYRPLLDEALRLAQGTDQLEALSAVALARAEAAWLEGQPEAIVAETTEAVNLAERAQDAACIGALAVWRRRGGIVAELSVGALEHHRQSLTGDWANAADALRARGCTYDAALALVDSDESDPLRQALDELMKMGATAAATIVARRLRELGERGIPRGPRAGTRETAAGLTHRELDVLQLLAEGLRNAEIADRLIVSPKTVDHHISSILRKLDARTRGQAAAAGARLGLIDGAAGELPRRS